MTQPFGQQPSPVIHVEMVPIGVQVPPWQVVLSVHASPSSQLDPSAMGAVVQASLASSQTALRQLVAPGHAFSTPAQTALSHLSLSVQKSPSSQVLPLKIVEAVHWP